MFRKVSWRTLKRSFFLVTVLVIYTDGIVEAMNADREEFGEAALLRILRESLTWTLVGTSLPSSLQCSSSAAANRATI